MQRRVGFQYNFIMENRRKPGVHNQHPDIFGRKTFNQKGSTYLFIRHYKFFQVVAYQDIFFLLLFHDSVCLINLEVFVQPHLSVSLDLNGIVPDCKNLSLDRIFFQGQLFNLSLAQGDIRQHSALFLLHLFCRWKFPDNRTYVEIHFFMFSGRQPYIPVNHLVRDHSGQVYHLAVPDQYLDLVVNIGIHGKTLKSHYPFAGIRSPGSGFLHIVRRTVKQKLYLLYRLLCVRGL